MAKANKPQKPVDAVEAAQQELPKAGHGFKLDGSGYRYKLPKFHVPGIGVRTALEAATDDTKYAELGNLTINEYLVSVGAGVIEEA